MDSLSQQVFEARVQLNVIFAQVPEQLVGPQHLGDSHQLQLHHTHTHITLGLTVGNEEVQPCVRPLSRSTARNDMKWVKITISIGRFYRSHQYET